ncbi:MAG TPA: TonB-dependent receptor [Prolixibacteraceae bacterium]|nr:TonB-dependent receptor [Prolixibacteraceae bacterium]
MSDGKHVCWFLFLMFCYPAVSAGSGFSKIEIPKTIILSGYVRDAKTGETLSDAFIYLKEKSEKAATTNSYGYFSLSLLSGSYAIVFQSMGYKTKTISVDLKENRSVTVDMEEESIALNEVVVTGERGNRNIVSTNAMTKMDVKEIQNIPVLFGERDILKTIQLLPGISPAGEGNAGFYVRGGSADQNLILLDEAPVYNPSHLLGFFSTFTSEAIKDITIYKGGFPAEFGGRLSSVVDIKMKDGNKEEFHVSGGIGLISSRLAVEGPLLKNKGSFMITARRTYADLFLKLLSGKGADSTASKTTLYFYDLNLKANYEFSAKDRLYLSCYMGRDNFNLSNSLGLKWGNVTATARWNHIVTDKMFSNTSLIFSRYSYNFNVAVGNKSMNVLSEIKDWNFKEDLHYYLNPNNLIKFGFNSIYHSFFPSKVDSSEVFNVKPADNRYAFENAVYISNEQTISKHLKATYGLRYSLFSSMGPGTIYNYNALSEIVDSVSYPKGKIFNTFAGLEPRLLVNYVINDSSSIKTSFARTRQYIHLLSNTTSSTPFDLWIPSNVNILPEIADQYTLGYFRNFKNDMYETSVEVYYKTLQNQIDYRNGADLILNNKVESQLVFGKGSSYGVEFYIKKKRGRLTGWISYTLSKTQRQFDAINSGKAFLAKQDRPHNISIVGMYEINPRLNISATWVFYNGNAVTFPSGRYVVEGNVVPLYTGRNEYRMPDYHRMDIGLTWINKKTEKFESSWNFSVYNVYGRENAYAINFKVDPKDATKMQAVQLSLFRFVPSVTYNFKF